MRARWSSSTGSASGLFQLRVRATSPYVGQSAGGARPRRRRRPAARRRAGRAPARRCAAPRWPRATILLVRGDAEAAAALAADMHLAFREDDAAASVEDTLFNRSSGLAEVMIPPRSAMIGQTVFPGMVTESGDLIIIAVQRAGRRRAAARRAAAAGRRHAAAAGHLEGARHPPQRSRRAGGELAGRGAPPGRAARGRARSRRSRSCWHGGPAGHGPRAAGRRRPARGGRADPDSASITVEQSYRAIDWTTVILVGAMMPLSTAMEQTGAAQLMAEGLVGVVGDAGPLRAAGRPVPADRDHGPAHQQHGDGADRDPDRRRRGAAASASRRARC